MSASTSDNRPPRAEDIIAIIRELSIPEKKRLFWVLERHPSLFDSTGYVLISKSLLDLFPDVLKKVLDREIESGKILKDIRSRLAKRNRQSSPDTIRRNVEICDKRKQDKKKWTLGRLAKDYKMRRQSIVSILKDEEKWRQLATQL